MDDAFVQAPEHRPVASVAEATGVPVINLSPLAATPPPPPPEAVDALATEVGAACRDWGFFMAVGHGVPEATAERAADVGRAFFALPAERKGAVQRTERASLGYYDGRGISPHELRPPPPAEEAGGELAFANKDMSNCAGLCDGL